MEDLASGQGKITLKKYKLPKGVDERLFLDMIDKGKAEPYEILHGKNVWLTTGWTELLKIITGASTNHFDASNTTIGVGNSATTASAADTDLAGTSTVYKIVTSGYPTTPTTGTVQFKARFSTTEGNFAHNELVVKNNASSVCWNRNTTGWGTKTATDIWDYVVTLGKA